MLNRRQLLIAAGVVALPVVTRPLDVGALRGPKMRDRAGAGGFVHPEWLADARWLAANLDDPALKVIGFQPVEEFERGHLPGALHVDQPMLRLEETSEAAVAAWRAGVGKLLSALGIRPSDRVVVYDGGDFYAARVWWALEQVGHADVRVLDGGLPAWVAEGFAVEPGPAPAGVTASYPVRPNEAAIVTIDEVLAALDAGDATFVDARKPEAYAEGHIPGAISIPLEANPVAEPPPYLKPAAELRRLYAGIDPDRLVIPYCAGGVRSAATSFVLRQLGYERVALFTGSWNEWSADPGRPVETGA